MTEGTLRYGDCDVKREETNLTGWFERRTNVLWSSRKWLELKGCMLSYRQAPQAEIGWSCDLRESHVLRGRRQREFVVRAPGTSDTVLVAPNEEAFDTWFAEIKRVSDVSVEATMLCGVPP